MTALFISDLHLCEECPAITRAFLSFLEGPARGARSLYILGDLFEYWVGDDDIDAPFNRRMANAIAALSGSGIAVHFLPGNRDFLVGERFAEETGVRLLADPALVDIAGRPALLSHGDVFCTDDHAYQAYRAQVRNPAWQHDFLARPLDQRKAFVEELRRRSESAKQVKASEIMDVNGDAVAAMLRAHAYPTLIHGHTHRPAHHQHLVDGRRCDRWVLPDWHDDAPYLEWGSDGPVMRRFAP